MNKDYLVFITVITSLIISANLSIILNIPYFRQIIPFILLTFVPGILIIQLLKLEHLKNLEKLVLSVGLSLIFITSVGLITNYVFFSSKPLNVPNILIIMDILLIVLLLLGYLINRVPPFKISINLNKTNSYEKVVLISSILCQH